QDFHRTWQRCQVWRTDPGDEREPPRGGVTLRERGGDSGEPGETVVLAIGPARGGDENHMKRLRSLHRREQGRWSMAGGQTDPKSLLGAKVIAHRQRGVDLDVLVVQYVQPCRRVLRDSGKPQRMGADSAHKMPARRGPGTDGQRALAHEA